MQKALDFAWGLYNSPTRRPPIPSCRKGGWAVWGRKSPLHAPNKDTAVHPSRIGGGVRVRVRGGEGGGSGSCSVGSGVRVQGIQGEVQQSISASSIPQAKRRRGAMRSRGGPVGDARTPSPRVTGTAASPLLPKPCAPAAGLGPSSLGSPGTDGTHRSSLHPPLSTGRCGPRKDIAPTHLPTHPPTHPPTARCFQGTRFYFGPSFEVRVGL